MGEYVGSSVSILCEVVVGVELVMCCVGNDDDLCSVILGE